MHFSIPDTEECKDEKGSSFTSYNLNVNGVFHCSIRYSQLHDFQEQLKKEFGHTFYGWDRFPPKKFLPMNPVQKTERREKLEKYIQAVSQDGRIINSDIFKGFLLSAQQETRKLDAEDVSLDVFLMNGNKVTVRIKSTDQTDEVTEVAAKKIGVPNKFVYYFALFLVKDDDQGKNGEIVRRLQDFESPHVSFKSAEGKNKIVFRKGYWDFNFDDELMEDRVSLQLLYVQTVSEVQQGWLSGSKEQFKRLEALKLKNSRKEYLQYAKTLKYYGHLTFRGCTVNYPKPDTRVIVCAGDKELCFRVKDSGGVERVGIFRLTRIRCWRIATAEDTSSQNGNEDTEDHLQLSFEYLIAKNNLQWITITTDQAILMSLTLQSMVDELLLVKRGGKMKRPADRVKGPTRQFKGRDGGVITTTSSTSPGVPEATTGSPTSPSTANEDNKIFSASGPVKKITEIFHSPSSPQSMAFSPPPTMEENDVFDGGIGEEDL